MDANPFQSITTGSLLENRLSKYSRTNPRIDYYFLYTFIIIIFFIFISLGLSSVL